MQNERKNNFLKLIKPKKNIEKVRNYQSKNKTNKKMQMPFLKWIFLRKFLFQQNSKFEQYEHAIEPHTHTHAETKNSKQTLIKRINEQSKIILLKENYFE